MPTLQAGGVRLGWRQWGEGPTPVLFVHGNLASKDWLELAARYFPPDLKVVGVDWRGCGDSEKPTPDKTFSNYSMQQHAEDMLAALDALGIERCHLVTHSTGGIIATRMLLAQPHRFGKVLALDPVTPLGLPFAAPQIELFRAMMASIDLTRSVMATAAVSLFAPDSLTGGAMPRFREGIGERAAFFERIVRQTFGAGEGVWIGTPVQLNLEHEQAELVPRMREIGNEHLVLWGEQDGWIPGADVRRMAAEMPHCRLVAVPGIGHSMNLEAPMLFAGYLAGFLGGLGAPS